MSGRRWSAGPVGRHAQRSNVCRSSLVNVNSGIGRPRGIGVLRFTRRTHGNNEQFHHFCLRTLEALSPWELIESRTLHWSPQYIALPAGITIQPFIQRYLAGDFWNFTGFGAWAGAS